MSKRSNELSSWEACPPCARVPPAKPKRTRNFFEGWWGGSGRERPEGVELVRVLALLERLLRSCTRSGLVHGAECSPGRGRRFPDGWSHVALLPQGPTPSVSSRDVDMLEDDIFCEKSQRILS